MIMPDMFKIKVKTLEGNILTYRKVKSYELKEGMIYFIDSKTGESKIFSTSQCEIQDEARLPAKREIQEEESGDGNY